MDATQPAANPDPPAAPSVARSRLRPGDPPLAARLRREIAGDVLFDAASRGRYATDASIYAIEPIGVVAPRDAEDLRRVLDIARDIKAPLLPRGGGTSQCGQTVGEALVVDCARHLDGIADLDLERRTVAVEPGVVLDRLNAFLKPHGLWFPVDVSTAAQATLGGMAGNNSCGSRSIAYGNMVHNVLAADVLLADGSAQRFGPMPGLVAGSEAERIARRVEWIAARERGEIERMYPTVMRRVGGYNLDIFHPRSERPYVADGLPNLAHLLVGSEGTLALTRSLTLALAPLPAHKALGVVNFPTFRGAMEAAQHIVRLGPAAVELVDRTMIELARANPAFRPTIERALVGRPDAILLVEFAGESRDAQLAALRRLVELMADLGLPGAVVEMPEEGPQKALWEVRKAGLNIMMSMKGDGKPVSFIEDCAVPLEHLADYTDRLTEVFRRHGTRGTWYAHASVGTLHVRPILDMRCDGAAKMRAIAEEAAELVRTYKGAFSGEHGDGLVRSEWVAWQFGPRLARAFEEIKDLFDPDGIMNPGKIVRASRMDDRSLFRFKPGRRPVALQTGLDWSDWDVHHDPATDTTTAPGTGGDPAQGFGKAVEMCNNNGHCRKFDAGAMCPSWRATREERDLTRGRANTLRLALGGELGQDALTSDAVHETLALCVGCKGCKRECPTGVDMARMKIEVLHQRAKRRGVGLRDRLVGWLPRYAPWAARFPALANLRDTLPGAAALSERFLGLAASRALPRWRSDTFLRDAKPAVSGGPEVVLFVDTFNNHHEPENARAALRVLEAAGRCVHLAVAPDGGRPLCCGRTFLAVGLVDEAKAEVRRSLAALLPFAERGVPIVGLEPSCLLGLRDEWTAMGFGAAARTIAAQALLFEEYLVREKAAGRLDLALRALPQSQALLHGHCHQKAFDAVRPVEEALRWIPGLKVETVESSCCGGAGAFGYQAEHRAVSERMAELSLLPRLRAAPADALVAADGTSCRHQIADCTRADPGGARRAEHVARILERALA